MTRLDALPELTHRWQAALSRFERYQCQDCWRLSTANWRELCPARVLAYAREQYAAGYHNGVRDAFAGKVALAANEADPTGPLIVVPVERMDEAAGYTLSRDPSQPASQPAPDRRPSRRTGSPAGGAPLPPDTDTDTDTEDQTP
jgi:hypothetical protein